MNKMRVKSLLLAALLPTPTMQLARSSTWPMAVRAVQQTIAAI